MGWREASSPLTRGCFPSSGMDLASRLVLPAHAGVLPIRSTTSGGAGVLPAHAGVLPPSAPTPAPRPCPPRSRGGASSRASRTTRHHASSPLTRGCFPRPRAVPSRAGVLPAHAGVLPSRPCRTAWRTCPPRSRGGASEHVVVGVRCLGSSPLTRGCFPDKRRERPSWQVLPAHAGVLPHMSAVSSWWWSPPRSRGGCFLGGAGGRGLGLVLPAHAGVLPWECSSSAAYAGPPRSRGGASMADRAARAFRESSPLTRGCFHEHYSCGGRTDIFPAHAGVLQEDDLVRHGDSSVGVVFSAVQRGLRRFLGTIGPQFAGGLGTVPVVRQARVAMRQVAPFQ